MLTGSCEPLVFWQIQILPVSTISSYLRLKIPKTYLLTNWIYRSPSFAWVICLFYIHIIILSSILDWPNRLLYPAYFCAYRSQYCFKQDTVSQSNYYALVQLFFFWHAVVLCCACKKNSFCHSTVGTCFEFWIYLLVFPSTGLEINCHILTLRFQIEDCLLSVHESHDFAYCKHYQYFILSPKYRLLHAYSHICLDIISRLPYLPRGVSQGQIWVEGWYQGRKGRYGNRHVIKSEVWSLKSEVRGQKSEDTSCFLYVQCSQLLCVISSEDSIVYYRGQWHFMHMTFVWRKIDVWLIKLIIRTLRSLMLTQLNVIIGILHTLGKHLLIE